MDKFLFFYDKRDNTPVYIPLSKLSLVTVSTSGETRIYFVERGKLYHFIATESIDTIGERINSLCV